MKRPTHSHRRGFTLVELVIAFTVLSLILGAIGMVSIAGRDAYRQGIQEATLEGKTRRVLERLASELTPCVATTLTPNPNNPLGVSSVQFRTCVGYGAGVQQWSTMTAIRFESDPADADDGVDNDTDGLVDEHQIVLVRNLGQADEVRSVILTNVAELLAGETANMADDNANGVIDETGFSIVADGTNTLRLRLTLQARDPKNNLVNCTMETSVHMRN
ncbi:MAG: prepilin-type N-terminal cleavage/methylation domain-containing protein [Planctomycetota bacterium]|nr:prepilin-type N-terminal cleavage/methylation domain-containing protein [Planctomycetota bacterium]